MSGFNAAQTEIRAPERLFFFFFVENFNQWASTTVMDCAHCSGGVSGLRSVVLGERLIRIKGCGRDTLQTSHCYLERVNISEAKEGFSR